MVNSLDLSHQMETLVVGAADILFYVKRFSTSGALQTFIIHSNSTSSALAGTCILV